MQVGWSSVLRGHMVTMALTTFKNNAQPMMAKPVVSGEYWPILSNT